MKKFVLGIVALLCFLIPAFGQDSSETKRIDNVLKGYIGKSFLILVDTGAVYDPSGHVVGKFFDSSFYDRSRDLRIFIRSGYATYKDGENHYINEVYYYLDDDY